MPFLLPNQQWKSTEGKTLQCTVLSASGKTWWLCCFQCSILFFRHVRIYFIAFTTTTTTTITTTTTSGICFTHPLFRRSLQIRPTAIKVSENLWGLLVQNFLQARCPSCQATVSKYLNDGKINVNKVMTIVISPYSIYIYIYIHGDLTINFSDWCDRHMACRKTPLQQHPTVKNFGNQRLRRVHQNKASKVVTLLISEINHPHYISCTLDIWATWKLRTRLSPLADYTAICSCCFMFQMQCTLNTHECTTWNQRKRDENLRRTHSLLFLRCPRSRGYETRGISFRQCSEERATATPVVLD